MTQQDIQTAIDYKKNVASKYMLVEGAKISSRLAGEKFYVTRKIDGHMQCVFYREGQSFMLNASGKQKAEQLKCMDMFTGFMGKAGIKNIVVAAELYLPREEGRPRCGDVARALVDPALRDQLALAVYDILSIDGEDFSAQNYGEVHAKLVELLRLKAQNQEGKTVFKKKADGTPFICGYHVKGFFKAAAQALRKVEGTRSSKLKAFKKQIDTLIFINEDEIPFIDWGMMDECQRPLRASTPQGERVSIAISESVAAGAQVEFTITCLVDDDTEYVREWLDYGRFNGIGQWRNSGKGRFVWEELTD